MNKKQLLRYTKQMVKENDYLIDNATRHTEVTYLKGVKTGMKRIINLIKRQDNGNKKKSTQS